MYFDEVKSWGKSVVTGEWNGYKPWLINDGYKDKSNAKPKFSGFAGYKFIEKGIEDWQTSLKNNVTVKRVGSTGKFEVAERIGYNWL